MIRDYHYDLGFAIDGVLVPDPTKFNGAVSGLDTLGERNKNGLLRRNLVAEKNHCSIEYENIDWEMARFIGLQMAGKEYFMFTYPDPFEPEATKTIKGYSGDRNWDLVWAPSDRPWLGNLKFNVVEQ